MFLRKFFVIIVSFIFFFSFQIEARTDALRDSVIQYASNYLKTPYRRGGMSPKAFDCSGFSCYVYKNFGYQLNRTSSEQAKNGIEVDKKNLKPGDLVLFKGRNSKANRIGHVGIVVESDETGSFKFIHASTKNGVKISSGDQLYYKQRYVTARRILEEEIKDNTNFLIPLQSKPFQLKMKSLIPVFSLFEQEKEPELYAGTSTADVSRK